MSRSQQYLTSMDTSGLDAMTRATFGCLDHEFRRPENANCLYHYTKLTTQQLLSCGSVKELKQWHAAMLIFLYADWSGRQS